MSEGNDSMTTDLPIGSIVRYKYKGDWEYAEVQEAVVRYA